MYGLFCYREPLSTYPIPKSLPSIVIVLWYLNRGKVGHSHHGQEYSRWQCLKSVTGVNVEGIYNIGRDKDCLGYASKVAEEIANTLHLAYPVMLQSRMLRRDIVHGE